MIWWKKEEEDCRHQEEGYLSKQALKIFAQTKDHTREGASFVRLRSFWIAQKIQKPFFYYFIERKTHGGMITRHWKSKDK